MKTPRSHGLVALVDFALPSRLRAVIVVVIAGLLWVTTASSGSADPATACGQPGFRETVDVGVELPSPIPGTNLPPRTYNLCDFMFPVPGGPFSGVPETQKGVPTLDDGDGFDFPSCQKFKDWLYGPILGEHILGVNSGPTVTSITFDAERSDPSTGMAIYLATWDFKEVGERIWYYRTSVVTWPDQTNAERARLIEIEELIRDHERMHATIDRNVVYELVPDISEALLMLKPAKSDSPEDIAEWRSKADKKANYNVYGDQENLLKAQHTVLRNALQQLFDAKEYGSSVQVAAFYPLPDPCENRIAIESRDGIELEALMADLATFEFEAMGEDGYEPVEPIAWSFEGAVAGIVPDEATGLLTQLVGQAREAGTFEVTVTAEDAEGARGELAVSLEVAPVEIESRLPGGIPGEAYDGGFDLRGPAGPVELGETWSVGTGDPPGWLVLDPPSGGVSGTPDVAGLHTFRIEASVPTGGDPIVIASDATITVEARWLLRQRYGSGTSEETKGYHSEPIPGTEDVNWILDVWTIEGSSSSVRSDEIAGAATRTTSSGFVDQICLMTTRVNCTTQSSSTVDFPVAGTENNPFVTYTVYGAEQAGTPRDVDIAYGVTGSITLIPEQPPDSGDPSFQRIQNSESVTVDFHIGTGGTLAFSLSFADVIYEIDENGVELREYYRCADPAPGGCSVGATPADGLNLRLHSVRNVGSSGGSIEIR